MKLEIETDGTIRGSKFKLEHSILPAQLESIGAFSWKADTSGLSECSIKLINVPIVARGIKDKNGRKWDIEVKNPSSMLTRITVRDDTGADVSKDYEGVEINLDSKGNNYVVLTPVLTNIFTAMNINYLDCGEVIESVKCHHKNTYTGLLSKRCADCNEVVP